ncbi:S9 family peptidase [Roseateles sp.]|uniref:S9 family peptidase n=1 Tax=Roseateles sp. TaxID=1971397 RepID=UPI0039EAA16B
MNVWVAPTHDRLQARQLTFDERRGIVSHSWSYDSTHLLYAQDRDGDENHQLHAIHVVTGDRRCLTPFPGTRSGIVAMSRERRGEVLIHLNRRDPRHADLFTLDLATGELTLLAENPGLMGFIVDENFQPRFASRPTFDGGLELLKADAAPAGEAFAWAVWDRFDADDARTSGLSHMDRTGERLYLHDSRGRDTAALVEVDLINGETRRVLAHHELADIGGLLTDRDTQRPLAYVVNHERPVLHLLDESWREEVAFLDAQGLGQWWPGSRTEDDQLWLIGSSSDQQPGSTWLFDRAHRSLTKLFDLRPELTGAPLARMQSITLRSRDGLPLICYLSLPTTVDTGWQLEALAPVPLVVFVHGGPWARDGFGFSSTHQWLCDRGYAVLNVNFRSSTGLGKTFLNAGNGEWGRRMDDDLDDAVDWAIARGVADPDRIAIAGVSYGGYAVLSALTRQPGRYACGIDVVGPSDLETLMRALPPHWEAGRRMLYRAVGNPDTEDGQAMLKERSPLHMADRISDPLLIAQGANDPRVAQSESDQMVKALVERGIPVSYALFPDEGHGISREPNRLVFNALMEAFLARHLGGALESFTSADFPGHTMQMRQGGEGLISG